MASLFQGSPQTATSYTTTSTETPKWMQDAIYNQIQMAQNVANTPYQQYAGPTVAELSPLQQQAYAKIQEGQGQFLPGVTQAQTGTQALASAPGGAATSQPFYQQASGMNPLQAASGLLGQAVDTSGVGAAQPYFNQQASALGGIDTGMGARTLSPYVQESLDSSGLSAAQPYMQAAGQTSAGDIQQFMNPYTQNVTDQIAKLGARNLSENLLPSVSDSFIRAGQFGGSRMGEFGSRALRDTQESVLAQQGQALQAGYGQALSAAQQEAQRQAGLASTAGGLGTAQQQAILSGGQALASAQQQAAQQEMARAQATGQIGTQLGALTQSQQQALLSAAQQTGNLTGQQQQLLANIGTQTGQMTNADLTRQQSALGQLADLARTGQAMTTADTAALESAGASQQAQMQAQLNAAKSQYEAERLYPQQQLDWLSTQVRGMAPITPSNTVQSGTTTGQTYSASPLSQLATGLYTYKGLTSQ